MRTLARFAIGALVAILVVEIGLRLVSSALPDPAPWPSPETRLKASQMSDLGCVDVVFLGTSVTESAVDPEGLPMTAYNASLPFATGASLAYWFQHFVEPSLCPDIVVIGVSMWRVMPAEGSDLLLEGLMAVDEFRNPTSLVDQVSMTSEIVRRRGQLKAIAEQWTPAYRPEATGLIGPLGNQLGYRDRTIAAFPPVVAGQPVVDREGLAKLLEAVRQSGATPVLMIEPSRCGPDGDCRGAASVETVRRRYLSFAANEGVTVFDLGVFEDPADYADPAHLNRRGTATFTAGVAELLEELVEP